MKKLIYMTLIAIMPLVFISEIYFLADPSTNKSYYNNFKNFNWNDPMYGDGIDYNPYSEDYITKFNESINDMGNITPQLYNDHIDYENFNTGFQWDQNIKKQSVTGVPLNKGFMPNGNYSYDFGISSPAQSYRMINSILDWEPNKDNDAKYNKSTKQPKQKKYVAANNVDTQDERLRFNYLGFSTRKHRTYDNTVVGTKNPFENTNLNWQYNDVFINWSGSWFEGPIVPPPADFIEIAHANGTKIYGDIFLDGYHGLTKDMLNDFMKKDSSGNYLVVDKLIEIANYIGFDGWFINNESNGSEPNGTILDYKEMYKIISQFQEKTSTSKDENIKNLKLIYYRNSATLNYSDIEKKYYDKETTYMVSAKYEDENFKKLIDIQVDFGETPENSTHFLNEYKDYTGSNINTIVDIGWNAQSFGFLDFQSLAYKKNKPGSSNQKYDKSIFNGFSTYADEGSGQFANDALKLTTRNMSDIRKYLFQNQIANHFNDILYSGSNLFLSNKDKGEDLSSLKDILNGLEYKKEYIKADPRIHFDKKYEVNEKVKTLYNYESFGGINQSSYGIGNLIKEKTIFIDENIDNSIIKTNFSTGNGIKFVNNNEIINYPWTNRRLADALPTYKWRIFDSKNRNNPLRIDQFSGGYDYDEVYSKGNSISIGSGFDETGKILDAENWNKSLNYGWDIIGTNIVDNNKTISIVYKDNVKQVDQSPDVSMRLTFSDAKGVVNDNSIKTVKPDRVIEKSNGWKEAVYNLSKDNLSNNNVLAMVGLNIKPNANKFKFNVGELTIKSNNYQYNTNVILIKNPKSEYVVYREFNKNILNNIRFSWETDNNVISDVDYFEIYIQYNNLWYRAGETNQNQYYLRDLKYDKGITIGIKPIYKNINLKGDIYKFNLNIKNYENK
ncbi:hypothetical protein SLITO_v1c04640 [Spiroplasma litorale]|uniref:Cytosolic endo-beta-N-acetylglucosaminidase TIM barrel domain-containing protein n=1 Tax=Spiroplasma litorale TaxID=216942 RepID=A0A0K1W1Y6_9MOLU|nr:hypothetical protein [Spiroplasma litorale]AKX34117.1 hypothetical protein SLITO_v1c04640 [Spiroplasma litorale]